MTADTRRDVEAITALVNLILDPAERVRPAFVIVALLAEFQKGMDEANAEELARWFSGEAETLAAEADPT